jgi:hypothetical protein
MQTVKYSICCRWRSEIKEQKSHYQDKEQNSKSYVDYLTFASRKHLINSFEENYFIKWECLTRVAGLLQSQTISLNALENQIIFKTSLAIDVDDWSGSHELPFSIFFLYILCVLLRFIDFQFIPTKFFRLVLLNSWEVG